MPEWDGDVSLRSTQRGPNETSGAGVAGGLVLRLIDDIRGN